MNVTIDEVRSVVFGAAVGDAVGVPFEFCSPESMKRRPATDMVGGGTYDMPAGTWSDDTTMILCTLDKLDGTLNYDAIMKAFVSWVDEGCYTPNGSCFDIGRTTSIALSNYARGCEPLKSGLSQDHNNGNGSLMRIIPAALYADAHGLDNSQSIGLAHLLSSLTHAHQRSLIGCGIFTLIAKELIAHPDKAEVSKALEKARKLYSLPEYSDQIGYYSRLLQGDFADLPEDAIRSSGHVVETLECAVWCLMNTDSYRDCILSAVNFGNDTDTAACVAGALAGLLYGLEDIPQDWKDKLIRPELIEQIITGFCKRNNIK